jgi:hypothetical protein
MIAACVERLAMRIAYLILAHHQPAHLARLVRALSGERSWFFVHVDKKADLGQFETLVPDGRHNVTFLRGAARVKVFWGGFSQVPATLNLLQAARASGVDFSRFCLLSGSDFPVRSNSQIAQRFCSEEEFLRVDRRLDLTDSNSHTANVSRFHLLDNSFLNPRTARSQRVCRLADEVLRRLPRPTYTRISLYHGAQWWALTRGCVEHIVEFLQSNPDYARFHRYTLSACEIFFHSIVKSSPFAGKTTHDFERAPSLDLDQQTNLHGCHYIDWNAVGVPLPKVLGPADLDAMLASGALFARKFEGDSSAEVVGQLERIRAE